MWKPRKEGSFVDSDLQLCQARKIRKAEPTKSKEASVETLRKNLDQLHSTHARSVDSDPIYFVHQYADPKDREIVAFVSAMYAFGNVKAIFRTMQNMVRFLGQNPHEKILGTTREELESYSFAKHRWITPSDTRMFLLLLQKILKQNQNLENSFIWSKERRTFEEAMSHWMDHLKTTLVKIQNKNLTLGQKFLLASPKSKSASKRLMMFFRWVIRDEFPDLGLWKSVLKSELFIPLDHHLYEFSKHLGFTKRKQANWTTVVEITENFKKVDPDDPIRYDFSLAQLGIRKHCIHKVDLSYCESCVIQTNCKMYQHFKKRKTNSLY